MYPERSERNGHLWDDDIFDIIWQQQKEIIALLLQYVFHQ